MSLCPPLRLVCLLALLPATVVRGQGQEPPTAPEDTPAQPADDSTDTSSPATPAPDSPPAASPDLKPEDTPAQPADAPAENLRPVQTWVEAQIELARRGFSGGSIDGVRGPQSAAALRAFQRSAGLAETGDLDKATRENLLLQSPAFTTHTFTPSDLGQLHPLPDTWLGKSQVDSLAYATGLEQAAERYHASPKFLKRLNPDTPWDALLPGMTITVPAVETVTLSGRVVKLHIGLAEHQLEGTDDTGRVILHFPVSIARNVEKRPVGELHVVTVVPDPNYTFDPALFTDSAEAKTLGHKLIIPPGPNGPVGVAWIGLDRTGYGIHGTPDPEKVGRTESHGCFRLANWDARTLLGVAWVGMPVMVEP
jgi:lipoprotein-anchoring transpeptidase ErfK/SrfK